MISQPDDVTICEGEGAVFTCVLNSNIGSGNVQWYKDSVIVDPNGRNINFLNHTSGGAINSSLTITNAGRSYAGNFWVRISSRTVCRVSLTILPSTYVCMYVCMYLCMFITTYVNTYVVSCIATLSFCEQGTAWCKNRNSICNICSCVTLLIVVL